MPALQVKNCPQDIYDTLVQTAESEHRTVEAQIIAILSKMFSFDAAKIRRQNALSATQKLAIKLPCNAVPPVELVTEDRNRSTTI